MDKRAAAGAGKRRVYRHAALALLLAVAALGLVVPAGSVASTPGGLTQLASPLGCFTSDLAFTPCAQTSNSAFSEPADLAVSPDGTSAYVADYVNDSVDEFSRNPATGALTPLGGGNVCIGEAGPPCTAGVGLVGASAVVVSPDGLNVYVASADGIGDDASIAEFTRDPSTGALTEVACLSDANIGGCTTAPPYATGIGAPTSIAISPDGSTVYVTGSYDQAIAAFARDLSAPGTLTQLATPDDCVTTMASGCGTTLVAGLTNPEAVTVSPDGNSVYVAAGGGASAGDVVVLSRNEGVTTPPPPTGALAYVGCIASSVATGCATTGAVGVDGPSGVAVSPDGTSVYVSSEQNDAVVEFARDPGSGNLTQLAAPNDCVTSDAGGCGHTGASGLAGASGVAVSPDDRTVYVSGLGDSAVAAFSRDPGTGDLTQLASPADCVTANANGCGTTSATALLDPGRLVVSPDNGDVYIASADGGQSALVALSRTPVTPPSGALTQLLEPNNCVGVVGGLAANTGNPAPAPFGSVGCDTLLTNANVSQSQVDVAVSPDGKNAYEVLNDNELVELRRDPATGALTYLGCITEASGCTINGADGLNGPTAVAISPDGLNVYVTGASDDAVAEFSRDPSTGLLTQLAGSGACISEVGSGGSCSNDTGYGLDGAVGVVVSPDGNDVYVAGAGDDAIAELQRSPIDGSLSPISTPNACISDGTVITPVTCTNTADGLGLDTPNTQTQTAIAISPDGTNVYVSAGGFNGNGDVAEFSRVPNTGVLTQLASPDDCVTSDAADTGCSTDNATNVSGADAIVVSPDGKNAYVADLYASAVLEFSRSPSGGALTQLGAPNQCIGGGCTTVADGLTIDPGVAISPDGLSVYATGSDDNAIGVLDRDPLSGALSQPPFPYNCLSSLYDSPTGCGTVNSAGFAGGWRATVSPDGSNVYEVALALPALVELARQAPLADLAVTASGLPSYALTGAPLGDTYTVTNNGPSPIEDAVFSASLPSEETLSSDSASQGSCSGSGPITCHFGPLEAGHSASVQVDTNAATTGTASANGTAANVSDVNDPTPANNTADTMTTILSPPTLDKNTDVAPVAGTVLVRLPGSHSFVPLPQAEQIPFGATIDATHGQVAITTALPNGTTQTGTFYDGIFVVTQTSDGRVTAKLTGGTYTGCPVVKRKGGRIRRSAAAAAKAKAKPKKKRGGTSVIRELWGSGHGDFTTKGRYGAASVRGTIWLTQDRCDGTYFRVTKDSVTVVAYAHPRRHRLLLQGHHYLVPATG